MSICIKHGDRVHSTPEDIVNAFSQYFSEFFSDMQLPLMQRNVNTCADIKIDRITFDDIHVAAKKLNNKLTSGPDGIPSFIVKDCICAFSAPLSKIFNLSLSSGLFPSCWKNKILSNSEKRRTNIAPICDFSKIFEIVFYLLIISYTKKHD